MGYLLIITDLSISMLQSVLSQVPHGDGIHGKARHGELTTPGSKKIELE